jgi:DhnA family fructose-bisphosphate aldolase class Ia
MTKTGATMKQQEFDATATRVAMNLEVDVIPVCDVERSKQFYQRLASRHPANVLESGMPVPPP